MIIDHLKINVRDFVRTREANVFTGILCGRDWLMVVEDLQKF